MARDLRTNTATRITVGPFLDKTDGITPEVALTATNEHLTLVVDTAGVPTLVLDANATASGGNNDMVHITNDDAGYYDLELTAAQLNYLGRAALSINYVTDHLPVFHEFNIITAAEFDRKYSTGATVADVKTVVDAILVDTAEIGAAGVGLTALATQTSVNTIDDFLDTEVAAILAAVDTEVGAIKAKTDLIGATVALESGGNIATILARIIGTLAAGTHNPQGGDAYARLGAPVGASISADLQTIEGQTDDIGVAGAGLTALGDTRLANLDATISSRLAPAGTLAACTLVNGLADGVITAAKIAADAITAAKVAADVHAEAADAVWDELVTGHDGAGKAGQQLWTDVDAILVDTAEIGAAGAGLTNINLPNQIMDITGNITGNLSGSVGSVTGAVGSVTGAVGSVTGAVGSVTADVGITQAGADKAWGTAARALTDKADFALSSASRDAIWDQISTLGGAYSFELLLARLYQMVNNKMIVTEATGAVALRNLADGADIATGNVQDLGATTQRNALAWV